MNCCTSPCSKVQSKVLLKCNHNPPLHTNVKYQVMLSTTFVNIRFCNGQKLVNNLGIFTLRRTHTHHILLCFHILGITVIPHIYFNKETINVNILPCLYLCYSNLQPETLMLKCLRIIMLRRYQTLFPPYYDPTLLHSYSHPII